MIPALRGAMHPWSSETGNIRLKGSGREKSPCIHENRTFTKAVIKSYFFYFPTADCEPTHSLTYCTVSVTGSADIS